MARYIDADKLLTDELTHTLPIGCGRSSGRVIVFADDIEHAPTADVVPKSEYIQQIAEVQGLREMVREIFEEIKEIGSFGEPIVDYICMSFDELAELKKKYTEGEE